MLISFTDFIKFLVTKTEDKKWWPSESKTVDLSTLQLGFSFDDIDNFIFCSNLAKLNSVRLYSGRIN